jgi:pimeloyl-ACP methyl ester carboxylesterase
VPFASEVVLFATARVPFASEVVPFATGRVPFASEVVLFATGRVPFASEVVLFATGRVPFAAAVVRTACTWTVNGQSSAARATAAAIVIGLSHFMTNAENSRGNPLGHHVPANGLTHHVLEWPAAAPVGTALLLHGFMDAAGTWDLVAPSLAEAGLRVLAPDLRGFGEGARIPAGGYYHFPDYVFDVADLVDALVPAGSPLVVVGHSMGGTVAALFAGSFPSRVTGLVVAEGAGPPDGEHGHAPERMARWIAETRSVKARGERTMPSREDALRRLVVNHPRVPVDVLRTRLDALARDLPDGRVVWRADPLHATRSPVTFFAASFKEFARRVTCPVLFVSGGSLGWHPPDEDDRVASFATVERAELADAGHMMHWTRPAELAQLLIRFALPG